jgi:hypothetical protein
MGSFVLRSYFLFCIKVLFIDLWEWFGDQFPMKEEET